MRKKLVGSWFSVVVGLSGAGCEVTTTGGGGDGAGGDGAGGDVSSGGAGGDGAGGAGGDGTGGAPPPPECFTPTRFSGTESFTAVDGATTGTFTFTLPGDPEGGVVTVMASGDQALGVIRVAGLQGDFTLLQAIPTGSRQFAGAPGTTYEVELSEGSVSGTEESQLVEVSWSLSSVVDCWEPNDTPSEARPIGLGQVVEAYLFAGYTANEWPSYEAHEDWYELEVPEDRTVTLGLASPVATSIQVLASDDSFVYDDFLVEDPLAASVELPAGTYRVKVFPFVSPIYNDFDGTAPNWTEPYVLTIE
jgi:hypothetical protein